MKKIFGFGKKKKWGPSPNTSDTGSVLSVGYELKDKDLSKLHRAASAGDVGKIKQLIKKQDINQLDKENRTPLHIACANGQLDTVKVLLEHKSKLNLCDNDNRSPLLKAIQCQQESCATVLLEHNADPNLVDINGNAALHLAALIPSVSIAKQLLEHGANINAFNKEGCTPLILAVTENNEEMVEFLLKEGADINACDRGGRTSLMISSNNGQNNLVRILLQNEADINIKDEKSWTADDYGVMNGHHACSHLIIEHGSKKRVNMSPCYGSIKRRETSIFNTPSTTGEAGCALASPATNKNDSHSQEESESCISGKSGDVDSWPSSDEDNDDLDFCPQKTPKPSLTQLLKKKKHALGNSSIATTQPVGFTLHSTSISEDESLHDSRDEDVNHQHHPKPFSQTPAFPHPLYFTPGSFTKPPQMASSPLSTITKQDSSNADDENDNSDFEESVESSPFKANMPSLNLSGETTYSEEKLQDVGGPGVRKVELMSELGLEEDDIESPWDSESASESSRKQVVSDLPLPAAKTQMQCISEESNEEFSEKSAVMEPKKPKLGHETLQKCVSSSKSVAKGNESALKPNLMDDLGLDDADDIEDASDWDSASLSPKYTMPHQRNINQVQNTREETLPRAEAPLPISSIIPPVPIQTVLKPNEDGQSTASEDEFNSTNNAIPEIPNCKEDSLKEKVENNTLHVLKTQSLTNVTVRNRTENAPHQAEHQAKTVMQNVEDILASSDLELSWEEKYEKMWVDNEKKYVKTHFKNITAELKQKFGELTEERRPQTNKTSTNESKPDNNKLFLASTDYTHTLPNSEQENDNAAGAEFKPTLVHSETSYSVTDGSLPSNNVPWDQDREKRSQGFIVNFGTSKKGNFADLPGLECKEKYVTVFQDQKCCNGSLKVEKPIEDTVSLAQKDDTLMIKDSDHLSSNLSKETMTLVSKVSKIQNFTKCLLDQQRGDKPEQVFLTEHASSGVMQASKVEASSVNLNKELEQDMQRFKNEVGILQMAFLNLAEEKGQLQKEADQKENKQYENSKTQSEQLKQENSNMFAEEAHTVSEQCADINQKLGSAKGMQNIMHFGNNTPSNGKVVLDGKLSWKQKKNTINGDPLEVFDDSTLSDTSQEDDGRYDFQVCRTPGKFTSKTNKLDNAGELEDFSPSSDTATEEYGTPTLPFRNAKMLIEQLGVDSQDSVNLLKFQNIIHEYERTIQRENGRYKLLASKVKKMENEKKDLQQIAEKNRELKSMLDHQKVESESDLNSLRFTLKQEEEKRKNAEMLYGKSQEQLRRKEDQCCQEMEAKQLLELTIRNLELEMRSMQNTVRQVEEERNEVQRLLSHEHNARIAQEDILNNIRRKSEEIENEKMWTKNAEVHGQLSKIDEREKDLILQNSNLQEEMNVLKLELDHVRSQNQQEESKYMDENENLKEKIADLRRDLKMNEETLTQTVIQYNSQLHALKTENTMLCSKLEHEKQGKDRLETELESIRSRLTSTLQEVERNQALKIEVERTLQRERDEWLRSQDKLNHELSTIRENNNNLSQQLIRAETKSNSLENELRQTNTSLQDKVILSESTQRELTHTCGRIKELEHTLQLEKDKICKSTVKQESLQEKLAQIQSENMLLRQQIEDVNNKGIIKDKTVSDVQDKFTEIIAKIRADAERQVQIIEERNKDLIIKYNETREQLYRLETEKVERESTLRQLQQELADALKKLSMSEASLEVITRYRNDIEGEKQILQKEVEKFRIKVQDLEEQCNQAERLHHQLKNLLEDKEREVMAVSQKVQEYSSAAAGDENAIKELEGHVQKLEIENAKFEATAKQQAGQIDILQKELRETLSIRHKLEELIASLQSSKMGLEEKLNHQVHKQTALSQSAQDSHNLWEEELKSRSRLGIRLAELEHEKAEFADQVESEKKKVKKLIEHKRSMEARFDQEIKRNAELQRDISGLKKLLKTAKKKIKELESVGTQQSTQDGFKSTHFEKEIDIMKLKEKINELSFRLENESSNYKQLEAANRDLQQQLSSMKMFHKSQEHLEKGKRQLEDEVANLKRQIEINKVDQSLIEKHKREIEERGRLELKQKLEEVNLFLQSQAASQETLEQIRAANDASVRNQMEHRIQELESDLGKIKNAQQENMLQRESTQTELERFKELYNEELKNRNSLALKLERSNERLADANAKLLNERQRTKSLIASSIMNGSLATSPVVDASSFGNFSNSGFRLGGSFLSSTANGMNTNRVENYLTKVRNLYLLSIMQVITGKYTLYFKAKYGKNTFQFI
ncbi:hypothetical protein XENTR_v10008666 [Xenopus tropicalis]|nr:hypothetical protein XENTR_v10008666 [Xenopus tropicalis]